MSGEEANAQPASAPEAAPAPEPAPEPKPEPTPAPTPATLAEKLDDVDLLSMTNLNLQLENQNLLLKNLDLQKAQVMSTAADIARALEFKRMELTKKYGRPVRRDTVAPDGTFIKRA